MVHQPVGLSSKALGKRPMRNGVAGTPSSLSALTPSADSPAADEETDEVCLVPSTGSVQTRFNNKRVLPSRMRRGGVGSLIGTNETDVNILDMLKRKGENEPLIPARTVFILTTDSSQVPSASTSEIGLNSIANERYFERPEVIRAYKKQQDIQVPEFTQLDEEMVGGKLRARSAGTESYELSDEAYEKRHRKHEMFEKRQRLREKEKLQHEHYKLKERIEQLRNMDPNAFLALPSDAFGASEASTGADLPDGAEPGIGSAASLHEAERRRKLMLDVAISLEERYRTLLPTERRPAEARFAAQQASASVEPSTADEDVNGISVTPEQDIEAGQKPPKLKMSLRGSAQLTPPPTAGTEPARKRKGISAPRESSPLPPEPEDIQESVIVTASHSISSRQKRSKMDQRSKSPHPVEYQPSEQMRKAMDNSSDALALANHVSHMSINEQNQYISARHDIPSAVDQNGRVPAPPIQETPSSTSTTSRRRRRAMGEADPHLNVIQHVPFPEREPSRKKKRPSRTHNENLDQVSEATESRSDTRYSISTTKATPAGDDAETERPGTLPLSQPDQPSTEHFELEATMADSRTSPNTSLPRDRRTIQLQQLRLLEQPDEDEEGEIEVIERPEVNETPTADEPITPPVAANVATDSIIAEDNETFLVPTSLEPVKKKQRRQSTPYTHPKTSVSLPPDLPESLSLSIVSMQSYEIPIVAGKGRKPKPLACLLEASKHNVEPGRKTGRSVKAFGVDVPPFDVGKDVDFELPFWMIREVAGRRKADNMSDSGSDGDPPSFTEGLAHGGEHDGMVSESISAARRRSADRR